MDARVYCVCVDHIDLHRPRKKEKKKESRQKKTRLNYQ